MLQRTSWVSSCSCYCYCSWHRRVGACGGCRRPGTDGFSSCCCCSCFLARLAGGEMHCFRHDGCQLWRIQTPNSSIPWLLNCKDFVSSHVVQRQFHIQMLYSNNNIFRCAATQQFLQLCSNNNFFRCAKLNISEEIENWERETNKQTNKHTKQHFFKTKTTQLYSISSQNRIPFGTYLLLLITQSFWTILFWWVVVQLGDAATTAYQPSKWTSWLPRNNNWWRTSFPTIQNPTTQEFVTNKKIVKGKRTLVGPSQGLLWVPLKDSYGSPL